MMKTTLESKPPGVRKAVVGTPAEARPGVRDYSGAAGGREKASAAARPAGGKAAAVSLLVALLWLSWCCGSWAQTTNAPGTRSNAWTGFSTNAPSTRTVAGTGTTTNSPSERSAGWIPLSPTYPLLNSSGEVVSPPGFWESNAPAIGLATPGVVTNNEKRTLSLYGGIRLLSPSSLNYWMITNDVDRERLTFAGEAGSEVSFIWSDGHQGLEAPEFYGGLSSASNLPIDGVSGLRSALADASNHVAGVSNAIVVPERIFVIEGDSTSDGDSWWRYFTNGMFYGEGRTTFVTNISVSSDGVGYGHPDAINAMSYKAISTVVIDASGLATATMTGYDWSWQQIRKFIVRSTSVPGLLGRYTISTPVYAGGNTTFTFQTGLGAQTITDARIESGAVTRYSALVRPHKPTGRQVGYYICYIGLNDGGRVYQSGDCSGLYGVGGGWANAVSNLAYCAKADGFKTVFATQWTQKNVWSSAGRGAGYAMNDAVRNLRDNATGEPLVDYLVDLEQALENPYDTRFFSSDGLHLSSVGYMLMAQEVDRTLRYGGAYSSAASWTNEVRKFSVFAGGMPPENYLTAPPGLFYLNRAATDYRTAWLKTSGTGNTGWEVIPTGKGTNEWSGGNAFTGPLTANLVRSAGVGCTTNAVLSLNVDMSKAYSSTNLGANITLAGVANANASETRQAVIVFGASGANRTVTLPAGMLSDDGLDVHTVTNGGWAILSVSTYGTALTNATWRSFWR